MNARMSVVLNFAAGIEPNAGIKCFLMVTSSHPRLFRPRMR
jgi:hypothetical protein